MSGHDQKPRRFRVSKKVGTCDIGCSVAELEAVLAGLREEHGEAAAGVSVELSESYGFHELHFIMRCDETDAEMQDRLNAEFEADLKQFEKLRARLGDAVK